MALKPINILCVFLVNMRKKSKKSLYFFNGNNYRDATVPKVGRPTKRKRYYKTLGTKVINGQLSPPLPNKSEA